VTGGNPRIWWIEGGARAPEPLSDFPRDETYKWLACLDEKGRLHVFAGDRSFDQHRDLLMAAIGQTRTRLQPLGGGHGGSRFPSFSQEFGPASEQIVAALTPTAAPPSKQRLWLLDVLEPFVAAPGTTATGIASAVAAAQTWRVTAELQDGGLALAFYEDSGALQEATLERDEVEGIVSRVVQRRQCRRSLGPLLDDLARLELPTSEVAVTGSGVLAMHGVRPARDLDLIVSVAVWERLASRHAVNRFGGFQSIDIEPLEFLGPGAHYTDPGRVGCSVEEQLRDADVWAGGRFVGLQLVRRVKAASEREKDVNDVELIDRWLTGSAAGRIEPG